MTIGEKNIIAAALNALLNNDLISRETLNKAFEELRLPQEYKRVYECDVVDFMDGTQYMQKDEQNEF